MKITIGVMMGVFSLLILLIIAFCMVHLYLISQGKTTKEQCLKKKSLSKHNKVSLCLIVGKPNFKNGAQWFSKSEYQQYKIYQQEAKHGQMVPETVEKQSNLFN